MKKQHILLAVLFCLFGFFQNNTFAQGDFDKVKIKSEKLSDNFYMLTGAGGNIGVLFGEDGVFMIDSQYAPLNKKIAAAIAKLTSQPVKYLLNTHWHGDHTGGNESIGKKGAIIIAHQNVKERMSTEQVRPFFGGITPPSPEIARPVITFKKDIALNLNGEDILIYHYHQGHTDGDAIVYFPKSNIIHTGDIYFAKRYPYIDLSSGGDVNGVIKNINEILFLADEDTKIIPGHGALSNKKELTEYRDMIMVIKDRVKKAVEAKMTLEEIKDSNLAKDYDEDWGDGFINSDKFVDIIYTDLTKSISN